MKTCDLHVHSTCSDGTLTPEEIIDLAVASGLSSCALTDHNNIEGLARFVKYGKEKGIETVPGCEFSADFEGKELHLLGLFIDEDKYDICREYLKTFVEGKELSCKLTLENLEKDGYPVSYEEFIKINGTGVKNRVHIANMLISKGIAKDRNDAFDNFIKEGGKYYVPPKKLDFLETIDFIHSIGAVAVWAHPLFHVNMERCEEILKVATKLDGAEVIYTTYTDEETAFMKEMVEKYNLIMSGGSDFHGANKPDVKIGVGRGNLVIPYDCYINLKNKSN